MKKKTIWLWLLFFPCLVFSQTTIKTMFYNVLNFPSANPQNRELIAREILDIYQPDLFMVCEIESVLGANLLLEESLNYNQNLYSRAQFIPNQSSSAEIQQMVYYRNDKFILESTQIIVNEVRDINHYTFTLKTENIATNPIVLEVYVCHLKSSQGSSNEQLRLQMVKGFTDDLETLDPDAFVIFAGDFNVYNSNEPAYIELLDPTNAIQMVDPIDTPGSWSNNIAFQNIHTQSTRTSSGPFGSGAGGGLDDRFDFISVSSNMMTNPKLRYIPQTYKAYGNNGNCFNENINNSICSGTFSEPLRDLLYNMSDHLPVVMELESDESIVLATSEILSKPSFSLGNTLVNEKVSIISEINSTIEVFNLLGQKITELIVSSAQQNVFDVSYLQSGMYLLKEKGRQTTPIKLLKT